MKQAFLMGIVAGALATVGVVPATAQSGAQSLGSVRITRSVLADGKPLPAGTYTVRLTPETPKPAVGQTAESERWVEFVQGGTVKGREVVSVVPDSEIGEIAEGPRPAKGRTRVEMLKVNDFLRVWINRAGTNYLIHMPPA